VISNASYNAKRRDIVILAVTSQIHQPLGFAEAIVEDWAQAGLIKTSAMKPVITTIERSLIVRRMGRLSATDEQSLRALLSRMLG
jgi:mRNA interferase MazF